MTTHWIPEQLLEPGVGVILDTETTDLDGRIIEISIIDAATGTVLMDQLINPQGAPICAEARTVHHISPDDLATAPTFTQVRPIGSSWPGTPPSTGSGLKQNTRCWGWGCRCGIGAA